MSNAEEKVVLILVGLVGSGKSSYATALEQYFPYRWRRCNQDDLGSRYQVEALARNSLRDGLSVCIDRTNIDQGQRAHWINIAHEFPGTLIYAIVFDTPYEECASRLRQRTSHPTIHGPEQGLSVLSRFARDFRQPAAYEGFDCIISLKPSDTKLNYSSAEISDILLRVQSSPVSTSLSWANRRGRSRAEGRHSQRGRGRGSTEQPATKSEEQVGLWRRVKEQGIGAIFPPQNNSDLDAKVASKAEPIEDDDRREVDGQNPPFDDSRNLLDSLGVD